MTSCNKNIVWFDLETTGIDPKTDRIIQICMVKTDSELNMVRVAIDFVNPCGVKSSKDAFEKHGIKDEELLNCPTFEDISDGVLEFIKNCDLGGHNCVKFDIPFLMAEFERCGKIFTIEKRRVFDTKLMDAHYNQRTLSNIYKEYYPEGTLCDMAHDASADTKMCIDIYKAMLEKHNPTTDELDEINGNKTRIDVAGFFVFNEQMKVCMGKGKYMGKPIEEVDPSYFTWMMKTDLPKETLNLANRCLAYVSKQTPQKE